MNFGVQVTSRLDDLPKAIQSAIDEAAERTGREVVAIAQSLAAVDTSSMQRGVYASTSMGSGYGKAASAAKSVNPKVSIVPEVQAAGPGELLLSDVVGHAGPNELGTARRPPRPFIGPAAERGAEVFGQNLMDVALERLGELDVG